MASTKQKPDYWLSTDGLLKIQSWASDGYTNEQIAQKIGISEATFYRWCKMEPHPEETDLPYRKIESFESLARFIAHARTGDEEVEVSVKMSATGYWIEEQYLDKKGQPKKVRRWIPPSDKAQALWLKNRKPDVWNRENEKKTDTSALERLDAILGSLSSSAQNDTEDDDQ